MGNVKKNKTANVPTKSGSSYKYSYTDLAAVNDYLEEQGLTYDQYTESFETVEGPTDYIMTQRYHVLDAGKLEAWGEPKRGLRVQYVAETPQQLGARITYLRRYSLLMAFGLAAEDNDGDGLEASPPPARVERPKAKVNFNEVRATLAEIDTNDDLEAYWKSLGDLSDSQAKFLQPMFAKRRKEINGVE